MRDLRMLCFMAAAVALGSITATMIDNGDDNTGGAGGGDEAPSGTEPLQAAGEDLGTTPDETGGDEQDGTDGNDEPDENDEED